MLALYGTWESSGLLGLIDAMTAEPYRNHWIALLIAVLIPILLIFARNEVRNRRLRIIADFIGSYPTIKRPDQSGQMWEAVPGSNPSLEFVTSKYISDLQQVPKNRRKLGVADTVLEIDELIRNSRIFGNRGDYRLLFSSLGFITLCYFGFAHLLDVLGNGLQVLKPDEVAACAPGRNCCAPDTFRAELEIIGSLAFAGAFIAATRIFMRSLAVFDLSAYTFLRQAVEIFASVLIVLFLYMAFINPAALMTNLATGDGGTRICGEVSWLWMGLAPALGLLPQSATKFLLVRMQSLVAWVKMNDDRFNSVTRSTPLDVIDGVDYTTRFRLEECGIFDIQNLAVYNPILLYVESPYGIYQTVDWIAQAQLCHIVGLERFLLLREMHVRTIFDLERSIDFKSRTSPESTTTSDGPDEFDRIYAGILFAATETMLTVGTISKVRPFMFDENKKVTPVAMDEFCRWAWDLVSKDDVRLKACVEHMMAWIADDLHVRRLRRVWQEMSDSLGPRSERLDNIATMQTTWCGQQCNDPQEAVLQPDPAAKIPADLKAPADLQGNADDSVPDTQEKL